VNVISFLTVKIQLACRPSTRAAWPQGCLEFVREP
jgi:hypothetical protein